MIVYEKTGKITGLVFTGPPFLQCMWLDITNFVLKYLLAFLYYPNLRPVDNALFFRNIVNFGFSLLVSCAGCCCLL